MSLHAWLTPDSINTLTICRRVVIPNTVEIIAAVNGALSELMYAHNWEKFGAITPEQIADAMQVMFYEYEYGGDYCMIGMIAAFATASTPDGWLYCDGGEYAKVDYTDLYNALDSAFIVDADTFAVPDLRGRTIISTNPGFPGITYDTGDSGGSPSESLTTAQIASHNHTSPAHSHGVYQATYQEAQAPVSAVESAKYIYAPSEAVAVTINNTGGGEPHNNMQPYMALRYCIRAR